MNRFYPSPNELHAGDHAPRTESAAQSRTQGVHQRPVSHSERKMENVKPCQRSAALVLLCCAVHELRGAKAKNGVSTYFKEMSHGIEGTKKRSKTVRFRVFLSSPDTRHQIDLRFRQTRTHDIITLHTESACCRRSLARHRPRE